MAAKSRFRVRTQPALGHTDTTEVAKTPHAPARLDSRARGRVATRVGQGCRQPLGVGNADAASQEGRKPRQRPDGRDFGDVLPDGWRARTITLRAGEALHLRTLGRSDLLRTKLFALCDRGIDMEDCVALGPTSRELEDALSWVAERDPHPGWPDHVASVLADLGRRLGHGV